MRSREWHISQNMPCVAVAYPKLWQGAWPGTYYNLQAMACWVPHAAAVKFATPCQTATLSSPKYCAWRTGSLQVRTIVCNLWMTLPIKHTSHNRVTGLCRDSHGSETKMMISLLRLIILANTLWLYCSCRVFSCNVINYVVSLVDTSGNISVIWDWFQVKLLIAHMEWKLLFFVLFTESAFLLQKFYVI